MTTSAFNGTNTGIQVATSNAPINNTQVYLALERLEIKPNPSTNVPFRRDPDFVDRGALFDQIDEKSSTEGSRVALVGLGGVGKSQIAIEYSYRVRHRSPETWVFWIHASNAARFKQSCREIADRVKIQDRQNPKANIFKLVHDWLQDETNGKWVLIFDNLDNDQFLHQAPPEQSGGESGIPRRSIEEYFPQSLRGFILITSRSRLAVSSMVEDSDIVPVDPMDETLALALFEKKLGLEAGDEREDFVNLVAALEFMPLAIVQAAAYIKRRAPRVSALRYLKKFQKNDSHKISLLDYEGGNLRRDREAKNSIIVTWQISFDHIREVRPSAADLLSLMSFFDRQGIPDSLLREDSDAEEDSYTQENMETKQHDKSPSAQPFEATIDCSDAESSSDSSILDVFEDDILLLKEYSLVSISADADKTDFEMHRLVQLAMQEWLKAHAQLEIFKERFIRKLYQNFPQGVLENWPRCQLLFAHVKCALTQRPHTKTSLEEWASLLHEGAYFSFKIGNYNDSIAMAQSAAKTREDLFGLEDAKSLKSAQVLSWSYYDAGQWDKAECLQIRVMETRKAQLGEDHPKTLVIMGDLASTYQKQGRLGEAEKLLVQAVEIGKTKLEEGHIDTLANMHILASIYERQGRYKEAEKLLGYVVEISKTKLGEDHPDTLASIHDLAFTYKEQERWDEAEKLFIYVVEIRKTRLGENHRDTLIGMRELASTYRNQGRYEEAEKGFLQLVEMRKAKLGENHPDTLDSMYELAYTYKKEERWEKAEKLFIHVVEASKTELGENHRDTLISMRELASTYRNSGQYKKAEKLFLRLVEIRKTELGENHPQTLVSMHSLALTYKEQGRYKEAEKLFVHVVEISKTELGENHRDTLDSMHSLALTYRKQGRFEEAEKLFEHVVETSKTELGENHRDTLISMRELASTYEEQGRWEEAEKLEALCED